MRAIAVVPTYRPGPDVVQRVRDLAMQVPVLVADDASPVTSDAALREMAAITGVEITRHAHQAGIARSLNAGLARATEHGAAWLLTVDQDSVVPDDYAERMVAFTSIACGIARIGAVGAGDVVDASGPIRYPVRKEAGLQVTDELIQTGTLWSVGALQAVGGFDESFGIDAVDAAACVRLRRAGYSLALAPEARIEHALGSARAIHILGRTVLATGHSAERRTTMVRNRLRLLPEELAVSPVQGLRSLRRLAVNTTLAVSVEKDRWAKAKGSIRGLLPKRGQ